MHQILPLALLSIGAASSLPEDAVERAAALAVEPLPGALVLHGGGALDEPVREAFVRLAGGGPARLVVVAPGKGAANLDAWEALDVAGVMLCQLTKGRQLRDEDALLALLDATGVWLAEAPEKLVGEPLFAALLAGVLRRGGVVGGSGEAASALARNLEGDGAALLPDTLLHAAYDEESDADALDRALAGRAGFLGLGVPTGSALVVYGGRRMGTVGQASVRVRARGSEGWSDLRREVSPDPYVERRDELPYDEDFLALLRAARLRTGPAFPPAETPVPEVREGALFLHGGGGVARASFERFVAHAGGKDARFVCIPSGTRDAAEHGVDSYSADEWREFGCSDVHVVHTTVRARAELDAALLAPLAEADAVWIDGGRTHLLMDRLGGTRVHAALFDVLARGGVVAGSSAGAQVLGDFLLRGRPTTNETLWYEGYQTGFAVLEGVVVDAHFRQRERQGPLAELVGELAGPLGVGLDEGTGLWIEGRTGEVLGDEAVSFYDARAGLEPVEHVLRAGARFDLAKRLKID